MLRPQPEQFATNEEYLQAMITFYEQTLESIASFPQSPYPSDVAAKALGWPTIKVSGKFKYR